MDNEENRRKENDKKLFEYCKEQGITLHPPTREDKKYMIRLDEITPEQFREIGEILKW